VPVFLRGNFVEEFDDWDKSGLSDLVGGCGRALGVSICFDEFTAGMVFVASLVCVNRGYMLNFSYAIKF